jgi:hypothetical protein
MGFVNELPVGNLGTAPFTANVGVKNVEDWQEWQIRADQVASDLQTEVDALENTYFSEGSDPTFRGFWPRFRDLKERVRTAPAIRLEPKLELERRLRGLGSRAYKAQEGAYARSGERKNELISAIQSLRTAAEEADSPRTLRTLRRDLDGIRSQFDAGTQLVPADRQAVWDTWRDANQFVWQRLTDMWTENETYLRGILTEAREQAERGNGNAARQAVGRFFESLRHRECKQNAISGLKAEADSIRQLAEQTESRRAAERIPSHQTQTVSPVESWRADLERNKESIGRLEDDVEQVERQIAETGSILEQAMLRGTLVEKRRKLSELERTNRTLEQRIDQAEEVPLIPAG